jgi:hypothetical protein
MRPTMAKRITVDHGEIIHYAGAHHLFPVARKDDDKQVRLASKESMTAEETRVGWPVYFRPFIDQGLVFLIDDAEGRAMPRAEADQLAQSV